MSTCCQKLKKSDLLQQENLYVNGRHRLGIDHMRYYSIPSIQVLETSLVGVGQIATQGKTSGYR